MKKEAERWARGRERDTLFNREVKLLWSFIVAKWTTSKRFDVTMVHPIKRTHVKIAVSARYTDCLYVSSSINLSLLPPFTARAHTHTVDSLLELVIYLLPPPPSPLLNRHVIPLSSEFHVNQRLVAAPLGPLALFPPFRSSTISNFRPRIYPFNH